MDRGVWGGVGVAGSVGVGGEGSLKRLVGGGGGGEARGTPLNVPSNTRRNHGGLSDRGGRSEGRGVGGGEKRQQSA